MIVGGWVLAVAAALSLQASPRGVAAQAPQIRVIRAEGADPIILEIANRTRAELTAAGLDATIIDCPHDDARCTGPAPPGDGAPRVVVTTARYRRATVTEVKVAAPDGPPLLLRLVVDADAADHDEPATLAVRAAELVRSALLQAGAFARPAMPRSAPSTEAITYDFEQPRQEPLPVGAAGWFAGVGAAMLGSADGFGTAYGVALRGGYSGLGWPGLAAAILVAAPALAATQHFDGGSVTLRQELAAAQVSLRFRWRARLQPRLQAGAGVYHLMAQGTTDPGSLYVGRSVGLRMPMATVGGGVTFAVDDRLTVFADGQALLMKKPVLLLGWQQIGGGGPSFLFSAGIERLF
ncbi:MAG TPA: hypothetical protein VGL59_03115 [Polyangia bacterium]